jgi:hypothetical protein
MVRNRTKALTTSTLASIALFAIQQIAAIIAPCSVKAYGNDRLPPRPFEITICDLKESNSDLVNWNRKSGGKRFMLRLTD